TRFYPLYFRALLLERTVGRAEEARAVYRVLETVDGPPESRVEVLIRRAQLETDVAAAQLALTAAVREAASYTSTGGRTWQLGASCALAWAAIRADDLDAMVTASAHCAALQHYEKDRADERSARFIARALDDAEPTAKVLAVRFPEPMLGTIALAVAD